MTPEHGRAALPRSCSLEAHPDAGPQVRGVVAVDLLPELMTLDVVSESCRSRLQKKRLHVHQTTSPREPSLYAIRKPLHVTCTLAEADSAGSGNAVAVLIL